MLDIKKYLEKFSKNLKNFEFQKEKILEIIKKETNIEIPKEKIEIKNNTVYLDGNPGLKNLIFLHKSKILEEIEKSDFKISDIR